MTYKVANSLRAAVAMFAACSNSSTYVAALRRKYTHVNEWEVCLYSANQVDSEYLNLVLFAQAICACANTLVCFRGQYNRAVIGEDLIDCIVIW